MCLTAIAGIGSALIGANAAKKASKSQSRAARNELQLQQNIYNETSDNFAPFRTGGLNAFTQMAADVSGGFEASPGFKFAQEQGMRGLMGSAAVGGNVRSGATEKAAMRFNNGLAAQDYNNFFNQRATVANMGQAAAGNQAAAGTNFAAGAGNAYSNMGNAAAAGAIGVNNAVQGGINNVLAGYQMNQMTGGSSPSINLPAQSAAGQAAFGSGRWF